LKISFQTYLLSYLKLVKQLDIFKFRVNYFLLCYLCCWIII